MPQGRLDLDELEARKILYRAIWTLLEQYAPGYTHTISKTRWSEKNARAAADMVRQGVTPEQATIAWHSASKRIGSPVRMLDVVQDELGKLAAPGSLKRKNDRGAAFDEAMLAKIKRDNAKAASSTASVEDLKEQLCAQFARREASA